MSFGWRLLRPWPDLVPSDPVLRGEVGGGVPVGVDPGGEGGGVDGGVGGGVNVGEDAPEHPWVPAPFPP